MFMTRRTVGKPEKSAVVVPFFDDEFDIDWSQVKPNWIEDHGTVIVLLGNAPDQDTMRGDPDPERDEDGIRRLSGYLNHRFWKPSIKIGVMEFANYSDKSKWPRQWVGNPSYDVGYFNRPVYGVHHYVANASTFRRLTCRRAP